MILSVYLWINTLAIIEMKLSREQITDIKDQQSQENITKRVVAPELEKILYEAVPALDHGFVRVTLRYVLKANEQY